MINLSLFFLDGLVAGGHCDVDNQCNATLGLQCVPEGGVDWEKSYCQCISGYADMSGKCFEVAPSGKNSRVSKFV